MLMAYIKVLSLLKYKIHNFQYICFIILILNETRRIQMLLKDISSLDCSLPKPHYLHVLLLWRIGLKHVIDSTEYGPLPKR